MIQSVSQLLPLLLLFIVIQITIHINDNIFAEPISSKENTTSKSPIKNIVVMIQGRHSFDNYFGKFPNADGFPLGIKIPSNPFVPNNVDFIEPFHIENMRYYKPKMIQ